MNKYINRYGILAVIITAVCFIMSSCGGDDEPTPKPTPVPDPTPTVNVQEIIESAITMNAEEMKLFVAVAEQEGGRAVLSGTVAETKASSKINIDGIYDTKKSCYVFDLSGLEAGKTYSYRVTVYNASGKKVMESKELTVIFPESDPTPVPDVQEIGESSITVSTEEFTLLVTIVRQEGGRAVMKVTKASQQIQIIGTYDNESGGYLFDLSNLEKDETYQYIIIIYNKDGQKVMESKELNVTLPESADVDKDGSEGGSEGMRGGTYVYNN